MREFRICNITNWSKENYDNIHINIYEYKKIYNSIQYFLTNVLISVDIVDCKGITYSLSCSTAIESDKEGNCIVTRSRATDDAVRLNFRLRRKSPKVAKPALNPHGEKQIFFPKGETELKLPLPMNADDNVRKLIEVVIAFKYAGSK